MAECLKTAEDKTTCPAKALEACKTLEEKKVGWVNFDELKKRMEELKRRAEEAARKAAQQAACIAKN